MHSLLLHRPHHPHRPDSTRPAEERALASPACHTRPRLSRPLAQATAQPTQYLLLRPARAARLPKSFAPVSSSESIGPPQPRPSSSIVATAARVSIRDLPYPCSPAPARSTLQLLSPCTRPLVPRPTTVSRHTAGKKFLRSRDTDVLQSGLALFRQSSSRGAAPLDPSAPVVAQALPSPVSPAPMCRAHTRRAHSQASQD